LLARHVLPSANIARCYTRDRDCDPFETVLDLFVIIHP